MKSVESLRLDELHPQSPIFPWYKWGPYVSERSWGTVREDYSRGGDAWNYLTYNMSKSKAYKWNEDGIAGISDRFQLLTLTFAFWNEKDRELKERLFGLNPFEANHGEDVKEYYYYLDNTPTHSYMKYLYKYTQNRYPYEYLIEENRKRGKPEREFELLDTGVMHEEKYFDIFIEYAKNDPDDICVKVEIINRGKEPASIHLIPQLLFRRQQDSKDPSYQKPQITHALSDHFQALVCDDFCSQSIKKLPFPYFLGQRYFYGTKEGEALFTNNETNHAVIDGKSNPTRYVKDGFHRHIVHKEHDTVNPAKIGTKAAFHYKSISLNPSESKSFLFRLSDKELQDPLHDVENIIALRKKEADEFYFTLHPKSATEEEKLIQRQSLASLLWSKQFYNFDVHKWLALEGKDKQFQDDREKIRNKHWKHLLSMRVMSMPDKWEYPWFAAWDLAFHTIPFALIDLKFAKEQLWLLLFDQFQHPNGQIPAYEWEFSEMNPPVHAWAVFRIFEYEMQKYGTADFEFLKKCFHKLMLNFTWWVNKVDSQGNNVFEGGFLGLDNITIIDRSMPIPGGGSLEQSDGTGWMGMFCLSMMRISLVLSKNEQVYQGIATKFFEHFVYIAAALHTEAGRGIKIWNDEDGFFYDVLNLAHGAAEQIMVRSLVGIIPTFGVEFITEEELDSLKEFNQNFLWFFSNRKDLVSSCVTLIEEGGKKQYMLSLMNKSQFQRVLKRVWDPAEFRSEFGLRSLSKVYENNPYVLFDNSIVYEPGEAVSWLKGGNSNWRGPIWFPTTFLLIDSLKKIHKNLGENFFIEANHKKVSALDMARFFSQALIKIFKKDPSGRRPAFGDQELMQSNPNWSDYLLFYEHFHADTGRGLGASHQTGWTALVASLIDEWSE